MDRVTSMREILNEKLNDDQGFYVELLEELPVRDGMTNLEKRILYAVYIIMINFIKNALDEINEISDSVWDCWKIYANDIKLDALNELTDILEETITGISGSGKYYQIHLETEAWLEKLREVKAKSEVAATREMNDSESNLKD